MDIPTLSKTHCCKYQLSENCRISDNNPLTGWQSKSACNPCHHYRRVHKLKKPSPLKASRKKEDIDPIVAKNRLWLTKAIV